MAKAKRAKPAPRQSEARPTVLYLAAWRDHRDLTQMQLGDFAGIDHGTISKIERGVQWLSPDTLLKLTAALRLSSPADLFRPPPTAEFDAWAFAGKVNALPGGARKKLLKFVEVFIDGDADK